MTNWNSEIFFVVRGKDDGKKPWSFWTVRNSVIKGIKAVTLLRNSLI